MINEFKQGKKMNGRIIPAMEYEAFQSLIDDFIERSSQEYGEMPASVFFELLFERMTKDAAETSTLDESTTDDEKAAHV